MTAPPKWAWVFSIQIKPMRGSSGPHQSKGTIDMVRIGREVPCRNQFRHDSGENPEGRLFVEHHMGRRLGDKRLVPLATDVNDDFIGQGAGRAEQGILLAQHIGGKALKAANDGIFPWPETGRNLRCLIHGPTHGRGGAGEHVTAKIDAHDGLSMAGQGREAPAVATTTNHIRRYGTDKGQGFLSVGRPSMTSANACHAARCPSLFRMCPRRLTPASADRLA